MRKQPHTCPPMRERPAATGGMVRRALLKLVPVLLTLLAAAGAARGSGETERVGRWINDLRSRDARVRVRAAYAYGRLEPLTREGVSLLVGGLKDADSHVRRYCASALGEFGAEPGLTVPALAAALKDPDQNVREHASVALVKIGPPAVASLVAALKDKETAFTPSSEVAEPPDGKRRPRAVTPLRDYAAFALIGIGVPAVPLLMEASAGEDPELRLYAAYILKEVGKSTGPSLAHFLNDPDGRVRLWAATRLADGEYAIAWGDYGLTVEETDAELALPVLLKNLQGGDKTFHAETLKALGRMRSAAAPGLPAIITLLKDGDEGVRSEAATTLEAIGGSARAALPALIAALRDPSPQVRKSALDALKGIDDRSPAVLRAIVGALSDGDAAVEDRAISVLMRLGRGAEETAPALVKLVKARLAAGGDANGVLYQYRWAFRTLHGDGAVAAAVELLADDNEHLRIFAIDLLEQFAPRDERAVAAVTPLLDDASRRVRIAAASFLGSAGVVRPATQRLSELLKDADPAVRRKAALALESFPAGARASVPALLVAAKDPAPEVRSAAALALGSAGDYSPAVVNALVEALSDGGEHVKTSAASAIGKLADAAEGAEVKDAFAGAAIPALVRAIRTGSAGAAGRSSHNWDILYALHEFGPRAVPAYLELLKPDDEYLFAHALSGLRMVAPRDKGVMAAIIKHFDDPRPAVRLSAVKAFHPSGWWHTSTYPESLPASVFPALTRLLGDPDAEVRVAALEILRERGRRGGEAVRDIEKLLQDPAPEVRVAAALTLLEITSDKRAAARSLARELHLPAGDSPDEDIEEGGGNPALAALKSLGEVAVPALREALKTGGVVARQNASALLKGLGPLARTAIPDLTHALKDSDARVRRNAAEAVGKFGPEAGDAGRLLLTLLDDPDEEVRRAAADALFATGFDLAQAGPAFHTANNDGFIRRTLKANLDDIATEVLRPLIDPNEMDCSYCIGHRERPTLPRLQWPPPRFSDWYVLPRRSLGTDATTLADVNERLTDALKNAGYDVRALFDAPGGYAVATKVERIREDGTSYPLPHRWTKGKIRPGSVKEYFDAFFLEKPGQFRMFVFIITDLHSIESSPENLSEEDAWGLYGRGGGVLPYELGRIPFRGRNCHVIIYRFQKKVGQGATIEHLDPLGLSSESHLRGAGLLKRLGL